MGARGNFFAVDRRVWDKLCALGRMNPVVAYLVLARGSQGDLRTTSWSTNAIEKYTGIPRQAGKAAIEELIRTGFIERRRTGKRPQYLVRPPEAVGLVRGRPRRLKPEQAALLEAVRANPGGISLPRKGRPDPNWPEGVSWGAAQSLIYHGLARRLLSSSSTLVPAEQAHPEGGGDWIWLPNTIVDGAADEVPPVERLRQSHSVTALRLYVDLYHAQALSEFGGVSFRQIRETYVRHDLGRYGQYALYRFMPKTIDVFPQRTSFCKKYIVQEDDFHDPEATKRRHNEGLAEFWADLRVLTDTGLASFVPHLVDADRDEGVVMHPLARDGEGEAAEREIGIAAHAAAVRMLSAIGQSGQCRSEARLVPAEAHIRHLALVGILRLRHRPHTTATATWIERGGGWIEVAERYRRLETASAAAA